jgi:hypothetical protein
MVGIQFARSTVVNFTILGPVSASWDDEAVALAPQQQLLIARLVYAGGKRVDRYDLMKVLSLSRRLDLPDGGLKRVVADLRARLKSVMPDEDPIPNVDRGYRLALDEQQADIFRFRAQCNEAVRRPGEEGVRLMRGALEEWAPDATGLFGDCALQGLGGNWAATTRYQLNSEYRRAIIHCLPLEMEDGRHREVFAECEQRGEAGQADVAPSGHKPQIALLDEEFLEVWLRAAYRSGQSARAREIGQWALETAACHDKAADPRVRRLTEQVAAEESRGRNAFRAGTATANQRPAISTPATEKPAPMPDSGNVFNFNNAGATIGQQVGALAGSIINNYGSIQRQQQAGQDETTGPGDFNGDPGDQEA